MRTRGYCSNPSCGIGPVELFAGVCRPCYQYAYRHGTARPTEIVIRSAPVLTARMLRRAAMAGVRV